MAEIEARVTELERWQSKVSIGIAVDGERRRHMDDRFDRIDGRLAKIESGFGKILWAIGLVILSQIARFIISGGIG